MTDIRNIVNKIKAKYILFLLIGYFIGQASSFGFNTLKRNIHPKNGKRRSLSTETKSFHPLSMSSEGDTKHETSHCENVLFVECGFGNDSHGQSATKAAVRACRNAIEFNSIPSINRLVPGGYDKLKLDVILAVPPKYQNELDLTAVAKVFPYGETKFVIQDGGMIAPSGIAIDSLGDKNDDMVVVCASVTVGY